MEITEGSDIGEFRAEVSRKNFARIALIGIGPGICFPGIYAAALALSTQTGRVCSNEPISTLDLEMAKRAYLNLNYETDHIAEQIKALGQQIEAMERRKSPECKPLKPYRQRSFYTQPGSRQDKYSRSKR